MEEIECIVCVSHYDDDRHRPRVLPCGHTVCSVCLEKGIRQASKSCPKCRRVYVASNVQDLSVNFALESIVKSVRTLGKLPECAEHMLSVTHRCFTHKAWVCQSCIKEDHSLESCKIITISEELKNKKTLQIKKNQPVVDEFEESCKALEKHEMICRKVIEDIDEEITRCKTIVKRLENEIQRKIAKKIKMDKIYGQFDQKLVAIRHKRGPYDKAVTTLMSADTIREVSNCSIEVQSKASDLQLTSQEIKKEVYMIQEAFKVSSKSSVEKTLGSHKLSIKKGDYHLHGFQMKTPNKSPFINLLFSDGNDQPLTDGIVTFLDISFSGQERRRVYMKMLGNTVRARQHLLLVTGHCGYSYKGLSFYKPDKDKRPNGDVIINPYDKEKASPLLNNVTATDVVYRERKAGLIIGAWCDGNRNNAFFGIIINDQPKTFLQSGFGQVTSGFEVLQDIAKSGEKEMINVVDCGVVLYI